MDSITTIGRSAPGFELPDLSGRLHRLSDFLGRIVVVNFWSAECPWSERVDREMLSLLQSWGEDVAVINIASNASEALDFLRQVAEERKLPLVLQDAGGKIATLYHASTTPHCFVVDAAGVLRYQGAFDDMTFRKRNPTRSYVKEVVDALLAGKVPELVETPSYGCAIVFEI